MKKMKKILAMLLAAVMVMGMSVTALADEPTSELSATVSPTTKPLENAPASSDTVAVKIGAVSGNPTVTLYQVASADYGKDGKGLIQYKWIDTQGSASCLVSENLV